MVKVISVEPMEDYQLRILLSNGNRGIFDVSPYLDKGVFCELKENTYFRRSKLDLLAIWPEMQAHHRTAPNGAGKFEFCIETEIGAKVQYCNYIRGGAM